MKSQDISVKPMSIPVFLRIYVILVLWFFIPTMVGMTQTVPEFTNSQSFNGGANAVALVDLDNDGDPDAVLARPSWPSEVWINQGGVFSDSGLRLGGDVANGVAVNDLNGDNKPDIFLSVGSNLASGTSAYQVWINQGTNSTGSLQPFVLRNQPGIPDYRGFEVALDDLDNDGDKDAVLGSNNGSGLKWLQNDGTGVFTNSSLNTSWLDVTDIALGDLNGDSRVDIVSTGSKLVSGGGYEILLNQLSNGQPTFGSPTLTPARSAIISTAVALADLDGDTDLDIVFTNQGGAREPEVHLNQGFLQGGTLGLFQDSGQRLNPNGVNQLQDDVVLMDMDDDGRPEAFFTGQAFDPSFRERNWLFLNNGLGQFTDSGMVLEDCPVGQSSCASSGDNRAVLTDVDNDGDIDAVVVSRTFSHLWLNQSVPPENQIPEADAGPDQLFSNCCFLVTLDGTGSFDPDGGPQPLTYTWTQIGGVDVTLSDASAANPSFAPPQGDTYIFELVVSDGTATSSDLVNILILPEPSPYELCVSDCKFGASPAPAPCWIGSETTCHLVCSPLLSADLETSGDSQLVSALTSTMDAATTVFDRDTFLQVYSAVRDQLLGNTVKGQHYIELYNTHNDEIAELLTNNFNLLVQGGEMLLEVQPAFAALLSGQGETQSITSEQVAAIDAFLSALSDQGSSSLQQAIIELRTLWGPLGNYVGKTMAETQESVLGASIDLTPPQITPQITGTPGLNGWYVSDIMVNWTISDPESSITATSGCDPVTITSDTSGQTFECSATSAGGTATQSVTVKRDATPPVLNPSVAPNPVLLNGSADASANAADNLSGLAMSSCGPVVTDSVGDHSLSCSAQDNAGNLASKNVLYSVHYGFSGFFSPVDNPPDFNTVKAGQSVVLKWNLRDESGSPVINLTNVKVTTTNLPCPSGSSDDWPEESAAGNSGLQNLGGGDYQFNWKSPESYANSCKTLKVDLGEGRAIEHTGFFQFKK